MSTHLSENSTYIRRPLFRTPKAPEILFETANVQNNQSFKDRNWVENRKTNAFTFIRSYIVQHIKFITIENSL